MTPHECPAAAPADQVATLIGRLTVAKLTVATAESLTGGLLATVLTSVPGSSAVVRGGLVVYATDLKHSLAGVPRQLLASRGPVHPAVAAALADGAQSQCQAVIGVGLTGVAGPEPQGGVPPGTWFVAARGPAGLLTASASPTNSSEPSMALNRNSIRWAAVHAALELIGEHCAAVER